MRGPWTIVGTMLLTIVAGLAATAVASEAGSEQRTTRRVTVRVATPAAGEANLAVVTFRGNLARRPALTNLRRLPSGILALAARRRLSNNRTQLWLAVLNRGPGATRTLASAGTRRQGDPMSTFLLNLRREGGIRSELRIERHSSLFEWPAADPPICRTVDPRDPDNLRNPRLFADWGQQRLVDDELDAWFNTLVLGLCNLAMNPVFVATLGVSHSDFTVVPTGLAQFILDGTISSSSRGYLITGLPSPAVRLGGADAPRCQGGTRGAENFVLCATQKAAGAGVNLQVTTRDTIDASGLSSIRSAMFDMNSRQKGPYIVMLRR